MEIVKCLCVRLETRVCVESTRAMLYLAFDSMINDYLQEVFLSYEIEILQLNNKILKDLEKLLISNFLMHEFFKLAIQEVAF